MIGLAASFSTLALLAILPALLVERTWGTAPPRDEDELGTNLALGAITLLCDAVILAGVAIVYGALSPHVRLIDPPPLSVQLPLAVVAGDLVAYWHHRLLHRVPWLWASHIVHHQSRHLELSSGLRNHPLVTITSALFWSPLLLLGIEPTTMLAAVGLIGTWVILIHCRQAAWFRRLPGPISYIFNLPGHHRAHHQEQWPAGNCNYGLLLILWDRLFGSYCPPVPATTAFGVREAPATGPVASLLWHEWRRVLRRSPAAPRRSRPIRGGAGIIAYGVAVLLLAGSHAALANWLG